MPEKIFSWLLRLYPSRFREAYSEEALQLFRDRAREERGFVPRLHLWFDLILDLVVALPREYWRPEPEVVAISTGGTREGIPEFLLLKTESPHPKVFFMGAAVSLMVLFGSAMAIRNSELFSGNALAGSSRLFGFDGEASPSSSSAANTAVARSATLSDTERRQVIRAIAEDLKKYYVYPEVGQKMADAILAREAHGDYGGITDSKTFAVLLTNQMREVSRDLHLSVRYSAAPLQEDSDRPNVTELAQYRIDMERYNCMFETVKILPRNIGYVKLNAFPDPSVCQDNVAAAMKTIGNVDAVIFDLRRNGGGNPYMVSLVAGYFFDRPTHLNDIYNRSENSTEQFWTRSSVPGNRLADKPLYILTSGYTLSGAEEFCYDMKNLKRATIIGEVTGGGAHMVRPRRLDDHFMFNLPFARPINPISKTDWEGTGVTPDIQVDRSDALDTAEKLALRKLHSN
jgi:Peptidase family S41/N-terminal domain of Peptidase_S41 in eukaryotic IRBP